LFVTDSGCSVLLLSKLYPTIRLCVLEAEILILQGVKEGSVRSCIPSAMINSENWLVLYQRMSV